MTEIDFFSKKEIEIYAKCVKCYVSAGDLNGYLVCGTRIGNKVLLLYPIYSAKFVHKSHQKIF